MGKILNDLWEDYQIAFRSDTEEQRALSRERAAIEERLRAGLTPEQMELLEEYDDCVGRNYAVSEKNAFLRGVRFAVSFFAEALAEG